MKKITFALLSALLWLPLQAQDIYKVETLTSRDLNGTARFVGMGGAMSALGADLSVMSSNPAGIGLYRHADVSLSASVMVQPDACNFGGKGKVGGSFDQIGFVYSIENEDPLRFFNMGFNYQRRSNARKYFDALGMDLVGYGNLSQAWQLADRAGFNPGNGEFTFLDLGNTEGYDRDCVTPSSLLAYETYLIDPDVDDVDGTPLGYVPHNLANSYDYQRVNWGGVHEFDFNMSFNIKDRVYAGLTVGVYSVGLHSYTDYSEWLTLAECPEPDTEYRYSMLSREKITGSGFDVKAGVIVRPIEESAFRLGFSVSTPTFYTLTGEAHLEMQTPKFNFPEGAENWEVEMVSNDIATGQYDYKVRTPWKINLSAATTVGTMLAVGAEYELQNYRGSQVRYDRGEPGGYDDYEYPNSEKDYFLADEIDRTMRPVHTLRLGAEVRADKVYMRAGYNFVSAPFKKDAYLNLFTQSESYYNQVNTDYVNLGATHRATCGFGYRGKHFYADLAYQYQTQSADIYAFHVLVDKKKPEVNELQGVSRDLERHNVLFTFGYKF